MIQIIKVFGKSWYIISPRNYKGKESTMVGTGKKKLTSGLG